jgi:glycogen synthase
MRVCLVSQEYPPGYVGGIGTQTWVKALGLRALGHEVEVLTAGAERGPQLAHRADQGIQVHELRSPGGEFPVLRTETYWLGYTWAVLGALRSLQRERCFDVIDFPDYAAEGLAYQLDRAEEDPSVVVVHLHGSLGMFAEQIGWPEPGERLHTVGIFMEDLAIRGADRLIAASSSIAELTANRLGLDAAEIAIVEGGVDTRTFSPRSTDCEIEAQDDEVLLFVGSLAANKGSQVVLESFIELAGRHPKLSLCLVGSGEEDTTELLQARVAEAGIGERVSMRGFVEHARLPELYRAATIFAAPSHYEGGLGMVYLEAMACGLPVVAVNRGGAAEAVIHEQTGLLLERGELAETIAAVERLLCDGGLRARLGAAGRSRAQSRFGEAAYASRVAEAYERAIQRRHESIGALSA